MLVKKKNPLHPECAKIASWLLHFRYNVREVWSKLVRGDIPSKQEFNAIYSLIDILREKGIINSITATDFRTRVQDIEGHLPAKIDPKLPPWERYHLLRHSRWDADRLIDKVTDIMFEKVVACEIEKRKEAPIKGRTVI